MSLVGTKIHDGSVVWNVKSRNSKATSDSDGLMSKEDKELVELLKLGYTSVGIISVLPTQHGTLYYNQGQIQVPTWDNYIDGSCTISGEISGEEAKTYTVTFTPTLAYTWGDGSRDPITRTWVISRPTVIPNNEIPSQVGIIYNDGTEKSPTWNVETPSSKYTITGITGTESGTYTATFTPTEAYIWADGTRTPKSITWTITAATVISEPILQSGTLTYDGTVQSPTWNSNYIANSCIVAGNTGTDAGSYTAIFTPAEAYVWADGTRNHKNISWSIGKAAGIITVKGSVEVDDVNLSKNIAVNNNSGAAITVTPADNTICTASYNNGNITINYVGSGNTTITVSSIATKNYTAATATISVEAVDATVIGTPAQSVELFYTGESQSPTWGNYIENSCTIDYTLSTTSATNAAEYTVVFIPVKGYLWSDTKDRSARNVNWSIKKDAANFSALSAAVELWQDDSANIWGRIANLADTDTELTENIGGLSSRITAIERKFEDTPVDKTVNEIVFSNKPHADYNSSNKQDFLTYVFGDDVPTPYSASGESEFIGYIF